MIGQPRRQALKFAVAISGATSLILLVTVASGALGRFTAADLPTFGAVVLSQFIAWAGAFRAFDGSRLATLGGVKAIWALATAGSIGALVFVITLSTGLGEGKNPLFRVSTWEDVVSFFGLGLFVFFAGTVALLILFAVADTIRHQIGRFRRTA